MRQVIDSKWAGLAEAWKAEQAELAARRTERRLPRLPRLVAGADVAYDAASDRMFAVALVWDRLEDRVVERVVRSARIDVPYIPTFLSFREGPLVSEAILALRTEYGAILFDGQGTAHPRRCGLATHVGVSLDKISVGVAKSRLCGTYDPPADETGAVSPLMHRGETIGLAVRTRPRCNPLFISPGHRITLEDSLRLTLACRTRYRLPEPTRLADIEVEKAKREAGTVSSDQHSTGQKGGKE